MVSIALIGTGNVSKHLFDAFMLSPKIKVLQVVGRNKNALEYYKAQTNTTNDFNKIVAADIHIIAVNDDVISDVSKQLAHTKNLVVHTSGSISINALPKGVRRGVFYPLQTFSKQSEINFKKVPFCLEVEKQDDLILLKQLASTLSDAVYEISSEQRKSIHLAAVFANNFTNHLYHIGNEICQQNDVPFEILKPLIAETAKKIEALTPINAQTGPAIRNDNETIANHIDQLKNKDHKDLYTLLTKSIQNSHGKKL